jgi:(p)ppGpp synthase/HD superfamily hydrolase
MHTYAQTNLQLFNQLCANGYSDADMARILQAYKVAMQLFTGQFRVCGKTFISHVVGTASILCSLRSSANAVAAGLLHAAYTNGDFGDGTKGIAPLKRERLRREVGHDVEDYVSRYSALRWNKQTIPAIRDGFDALDPIDREVLLMRLANELEEYLDLGLIYGRDLKQHTDAPHDINVVVEIAEKLGCPTLASELVKVYRESFLVAHPLELRTLSVQSYSTLIPPRSYRRRLSVLAYHWFERGYGSFRSALGMRKNPHSESKPKSR